MIESFEVSLDELELSDPIMYKNKVSESPFKLEDVKLEAWIRLKLVHVCSSDTEGR